MTVQLGVRQRSLLAIKLSLREAFPQLFFEAWEIPTMNGEVRVRVHLGPIGNAPVIDTCELRHHCPSPTLRTQLMLLA